jgi:hypothetical protein
MVAEMTLLALERAFFAVLIAAWVAAGFYWMH